MKMPLVNPPKPRPPGTWPVTEGDKRVTGSGSREPVNLIVGANGGEPYVDDAGSQGGILAFVSSIPPLYLLGGAAALFFFLSSGGEE